MTDRFPSDSNPFAAPEHVGERVDFEPRLPLAGVLTRLGAKMIDGLATVLIFFPGMFVFIAVAPDGGNNRGGSEAVVAVGALLFAVAGLGLLVYQCWRLTTHGQTIGKQICRIRIVDQHSQELPGFVRAVLLRGLVIAILNQVVPFFGLLDALFIFGSERRCIHDYLAGTIVVEAG